MFVCCTVGDFSMDMDRLIPLSWQVAITSCLSFFNVLFNAPFWELTSSPQNAFVQLSLAFRNDNYTLEMRLKQAERERNLTEEDTEKELEDFKGALKVSPWKQQLTLN